MPTSKETESSLSYVQCLLYFIFSSINVSIFILHGWIPSGQISCVIWVMHLAQKKKRVRPNFKGLECWDKDFKCLQYRILNGEPLMVYTWEASKSSLCFKGTLGQQDGPVLKRAAHRGREA